MAKKKLRIKIETTEEKIEEEVMGLYQKEKIIYYDKDNNKIEYNTAKHRLFKETSDMIIDYFFNIKDSSKGLLIIKDLKKRIPVEIETKELIENEKMISITYKVFDHQVKYQIEVIK